MILKNSNAKSWILFHPDHDNYMVFQYDDTNLEGVAHVGEDAWDTDLNTVLSNGWELVKEQKEDLVV